MTDEIVIHRRQAHPSPMRTRRIGSVAGAAAAAGVDFPGIAIPDPEGTRGRWVSGGISLLLHGAAISAIVLAAWLAPEEMIEEIIEITRIEEEIASEEPAPAPRVLAETFGRYDPAPMAVTPQIVSPAVVQRVAPVINAEQLQIDTLSPVQAPREVQRASRQVQVARTYQSVAQVTRSPLTIDAAAPAIRGPVELHAPSGIQAGPRQVARGSGVGIADPSALGSGSSVREGIASNRDVLGAKTGVRAQVNWAVGDSNMRGSGGQGTGPGGLSWEQCMSRPEVQAYMQHIKTRVLNRWILPADVAANHSVTLRFVLDPAGTANRVVFVSTNDNVLGASAVKAMQSASPFDQMSDRVRCLAGNPIIATFRNPTVATN
jgi:outer membrane biosynthesis protein TonB